MKYIATVFLLTISLLYPLTFKLATKENLKYNMFGGNGCPLRKGGVMPMQYVTYDNLIQFGLLIVAVIGLSYKISCKDKK